MSWEFILRLVIAGLLGAGIGLEREIRAKEAGIRTHFIVALGSALFMLISQFAFDGRFDAARVAAQVVSGIGFIGAGVIIFQKNVVRGITTAAGLWVAAGIGLACGAGMFDIAIAAALLTIMCLETMHFITKRYGERTVLMVIHDIKADEFKPIIAKIEKCRVEVLNYGISESVAQIEMRIRHRYYSETFQELIAITKGYDVDIE
ncbi:MAG: MgtC/SapB family protein [Bacteroidales bacterium]|nr:MgtC/SapB family protein [Bacteroidales bacterium]